jgi:Fic family protein
MPESETPSREEELRDLLTDAIEVQLAALKAGISFWSEWIEETSAFVQSATDSLSAINSGDQKTEDVLLELLDRGRESARAMTEIPRHTATRFIEELDAAGEKKAVPAGSSASRATARSKGASKGGRAGGKPRPKRAGRAKD